MEIVSRILLRLYAYWIFRKKVYVHGFIHVGDRKRVTIGDRCSINRQVEIPAQCKVVIGNDVTLSTRCMLLDSGLRFGGGACTSARIATMSMARSSSRTAPGSGPARSSCRTWWWARAAWSAPAAW